MGKLIFQVFLVLLAIAIFMVPTRPMLDEIDNLKIEKDKINAALENAEEIIRVRDALQEKYSRFSAADLNKLEKMLPDNVDNVRLIIDMDNIAQKYDMILRDPKVRTQDQAIESGEILAGTSLNSEFDTVELGFSLDGNYESFRKFLIDLEKSLRIVDIIKVSFSPDVITGEATYRIETHTYWLNSNK